MIQLQGKSASKGVAIGTLCFYQRGSREIDRAQVKDAEAEIERFACARRTAMDQLRELYEKSVTQIGKEAAELFEAHQMMLEDLDFTEGITERIRDGSSAEAAVQDTAEQLAEMFAGMDDNTYMQARSADVRDIAERVIRILSGGMDKNLPADKPVILASDDFSPSETVQMDQTKLLALLTSGGSVQGHTAILARTMGIPSVCQLGEALCQSLDGKTAAVNGTTGEVFIEPDEKTLRQLTKIAEKEQQQKNRLEALKGKPSRTIDGKNVMLCCNIGSLDDIDAVFANDGEGIGLFRSEFLYLERHDYPSEEEQYQAYKAVLERMAGKRVIIRTLDIGADKQADYFGLKNEKNPAMGLRAIRLCLTRPELFRTQLRALYRASAYGKAAILFPMITSVWEVREIKRICESVQCELRAEGAAFADTVELGIMIETPAAVLLSDRLAKEVDFFSVGTNDLTQYLLAVDRQGKGLEAFFDARHPSLLRAIKMAADNAHKAGIWIGICGELGADRELCELFLAMGIEELSVPPTAVLPLRSEIRSIDTRKNRQALLEQLASNAE
jgi:phosphotransferase system enzyme I (PtsI)